MKSGDSEANNSLNGNEGSDAPATESTSLSSDNRSKNSTTPWNYVADEFSPVTSSQPVSWSASEFIDHDKQIGWFMVVGAVAVLTAAVIYLLTRDVINAVVIIIVAILFAISGARKPRILTYVLDEYGIHIANKPYGYNEFRSFAVMEEGAISSIQLYPFKRFSTPISLFFPPDQENTIVNMLGTYLPHEIRKHDPIDRLMRKVRF